MSIHIETIGSGPDLVLIHGWAMHGGIFAPLTPLLAAHFRVHLVDLPGHGFSRAATGAPDLDAWVRELLDATPPAVWTGWSLGGLVALKAALGRPQQVQGLVEIASSPRFVNDEDWQLGVDGDVFAQFGAGLQAHFELAIERFLALETLGSANAQAELRDLKVRVFERGKPDMRALSAGLRMLDSVDLRSELHSLRVPSLWIAGRRDRLVPSAAMRWAASESIQGVFVEIASGHAPFIGHAAEVATNIIEFARKLPV